MKPHNRKILQLNHKPPPPSYGEPPLSPSATYGEPLFEPLISVTTKQQPFEPNTNSSPFDSSMALTILVLLTALFFMGFFSIYIRRFGDGTTNLSHRRRHHRPSPSSSSSSSFAALSFSYKGIDLSVVQSLPVLPYDAKEFTSTTACSICLSEFVEEESVKMIPYCRHVFHPVCVDRWLSSHVSCPLCRTTQLFASVEAAAGCSGVVEGGGDQDMSELQNRSTVYTEDTWTMGLRRASSCSSILGERVLLRRTNSF